MSESRCRDTSTREKWKGFRGLPCPWRSTWSILPRSVAFLPGGNETRRLGERKRSCRRADEEVGVSSRENPSSPFWTYRMEVSPTGQSPAQPAPNYNDPATLLHLLLNLQTQILDV